HADLHELAGHNLLLRFSLHHFNHGASSCQPRRERRTRRGFAEPNGPKANPEWTGKAASPPPGEGVLLLDSHGFTSNSPRATKAPRPSSSGPDPRNRSPRSSSSRTADRSPSSHGEPDRASRGRSSARAPLWST